jgi:hypothetical protein
VNFRGGFKRSGPAGYHLHIHTYKIVEFHPDKCEEFATDLHENHLESSHGIHIPRWGMHYFHAHMLSGVEGPYSIYSVPTGYGFYNTRHVGIGVTADAGAFCTFNGTYPHVHDELWVGPCPYGLPGYERRGLDPPPLFFAVGQTYQNNAHWTRHMQWGEGGQQPSC